MNPPKTENVWHEHTYVRSSETDFRSRWKVSGFFAAMVEAAGHHANHLGFGYPTMVEKNTVWILSRLKIRFSTFPQIEDKIIIETWPKGIGQKVFFLRDYQVRRPTGEHLASATSAYILINPGARKMLPPQALDGTVPDNSGRAALEEALEKLPAAEPLEHCFTAAAGYSAVDVMGHVNNTRYIDWICDCFSFTEQDGMMLSWLQINYLNEVKPGETVAIYRSPYPDTPGAWYITGLNEVTGMKSFEAALGWEP